MDTTTRRALLGTTAATAAASTAGCSAVMDFFSSDLNIWVHNDTEEEISYQISVEDVEESGTLPGGEGDTYEDVMEKPSSGSDIRVDAAFGFEIDGEFTAIHEGGDDLTVGSDTEAVFARYTEMGAFYGLSESSGIENASDSNET